MKRFFESSYLTWEIISSENVEHIQGLFEHLTYLEDNEQETWKHIDTSDYFFNRRPIGGERPVPILNLNISREEFISILLKYDLAHEEQMDFAEDSSMQDYRHEIRNSYCFSNISYSIFFDLEGNRIRHIWFDYEDRISRENDRHSITDLLNDLGTRYSLSLIDWYEKIMIDLSDRKAIAQYLEDTAEENRTFFEAIKNDKN